MQHHRRHSTRKSSPERNENLANPMEESSLSEVQANTGDIGMPAKGSGVGGNIHKLNQMLDGLYLQNRPKKAPKKKFHLKI
jgi:hypothetical protein